MRRLSTLVALVVLGAALIVSSAKADGTVSLTNGSFGTNAANPIYTVSGAAYSLTTNAINDTVTFGLTPFAAESTTVLRYAIDGYKWCAVWFTAKQAAGDTSVVRVALEARAHTSTAADSLSMAVIPDWSINGGGVASDTTVVAGTNIFGASGSAVALAAPWYGEHVIAINPTRGYGGVAEANQYFGFPNNFYFPLVTTKGADIRALLISFRARVLAPQSASSKVRLVMHVVMGT